MRTLARLMPPDWIAPKVQHPDDPLIGAPLNLDVLGDAVFCDGQDRDSDNIISVFSHPFYHQVLYSEFMHGWANKAMEQKEWSLRRLIKERKVTEVVWLYERPYRAPYIHWLWQMKEGYTIEDPPGFPDQWADLIDPIIESFGNQYAEDPRPFWNKARETWTDNENIHQEIQRWHDMWFDPEGGELWMDDDNKERFVELPKKIELWRGECNDGGFSYSTDKDIGEFFARRGVNESTGEVVRLEIPKEAAFCFIGDRNEEEVVVLEDLSEYEIERYSVRSN